MIYSRYGTPLTLLSKSQDSCGKVLVWASSEGTEGIREYQQGDLVADEGSTEIAAAIAKLPVKKK